MEEEEVCKEENRQVMKVLEALKQASQDLQTNPSSSIKHDDSNSSAVKALLELDSDFDAIFSSDPNLLTLSNLLSNLKTLVAEFHRCSFLRRRFKSREISRVAGAIESEIQAWIDRESIENLVKALAGQRLPADEDETVNLLSQFEARVSQGFNRDLQSLVLKSRVFNALESVLCDSKSSKRIREQSGLVVGALVQFNKDVFVGEVLMGPTIRALITMGTNWSIKALCTLIRTIKSPLVDEIEGNEEIPKIINFLNSEEVSIKVLALDCVLEIGYFGRKEAIEAMLEQGLIKKLVELQRSELGGDLIEMGRVGDESGVSVGGVEMKKNREKRFLENHPLASCVARFAIQLEVGEGLRQREKRGFKQEILRRVRDACVSEAVSATILAEVLWGASP